MALQVHAKPGFHAPQAKRTLANDIAIPIVFPDYEVLIEEVHERLPLGHAGILFINGGTGLTKYYEYGRYDTAHKGLTRHQRIPDVKIEHAKPTQASLTKTLQQISYEAGHRTRIEAAYIALPPGAFRKMLKFCEDRVALNSDPKRREYNILLFSCETFVYDVAVAGGADMPSGALGIPRIFIERVRSKYPSIDYAPKTGIMAGAGY